jgi:phosphate transport system substrate-binding protein
VPGGAEQGAGKEEDNESKRKEGPCARAERIEVRRLDETKVGGRGLLPTKLGGRGLLLVGILTAAVAAPAAARTVTLYGSGSSAAYPYMQELFRGYSKLHKNIRFRYIQDGGNAGVQDVQAGRSQFAIQTRLPLPSDSGTTWDKLFLDGLCIAVNPANSLSDVSLSQLKDIFLATDTNWSQVAGSNLSTTIDPQGRNSAAGTYTFFQQSVLGGATQASNVSELTSDGLVAVAVRNDRNAIGYVGLAHSGNGSGVNKLLVGGVPCDTAHIRNESYPLFRYIWSVIPNTAPSIQVENFLDWVRTSKAAGTIIGRAGAVPAFNKH